MNVYVIYRFDDYDNVKQYIKQVEERLRNVTFFYFKPENKPAIWHRRAAKKIKESNMVIFFDTFSGETSHTCKHIMWELKRAEKYKKRIVVFKDDVNDIKRYSSKIYSTDYSDDIPNRYRYKAEPLSRLVPYLSEQASWNVEQNLIKKITKEQTALTEEDRQLLLEQYKIMIDTSEKLMERRQATANLYTTICSALIAFVGTSFSAGISMISAMVCLLAGIITLMLCFNWRSSLKAYELNNTGKFEVINQIERHLPAEMFDCEYRYNTFNGIRSYSKRERTLPLVFIFFGATLILVAVIMFILLARGA